MALPVRTPDVGGMYLSLANMREQAKARQMELKQAEEQRAFQKMQQEFQNQMAQKQMEQQAAQRDIENALRERQVMSGVNLAEHEVLKPLMLNMGYAPGGMQTALTAQSLSPKPTWKR